MHPLALVQIINVQMNLGNLSLPTWKSMNWNPHVRGGSHLGKMKSLFMEMPLPCASLRWRRFIFPLTPDKKNCFKNVQAFKLLSCVHPLPPLFFPTSLSGLGCSLWDFSYLARHWTRGLGNENTESHLLDHQGNPLPPYSNFQTTQVNSPSHAVFCCFFFLFSISELFLIFF